VKRPAIVALLFATIVFCTGCDNRMVIPAGTALYRPQIEQNECVFLYVDYTSEIIDGKPQSETQAEYSGVLTKTIECPYNRNSQPIKIALTKTSQNRLLWVRFTDIRSS